MVVRWRSGGRDGKLVVGKRIKEFRKQIGNNNGIFANSKVQVEEIMWNHGIN